MLKRSVLGVLCCLLGCGQVKSLGENEGGSSGEAGDTGATSGGASAGGQFNGYGGNLLPKGGAPGKGGAAGTGGSTSAGAGGGDSVLTPYPLAPSVPVPADCTCESASLVCNADAECVPRCDAEGDCALWRIEHQMSELLADGYQVYMLEEPQRDVLGNPPDRQRLFKADLIAPGDGAPRLLAEFDSLGSWWTFIGRAGNVTYVRRDGQNGVVAIHDNGTVTELEAPPDYYDVTLGAAAMFFINAEGVWQRELDVAAPPVRLVEEAIAEGSWLKVADKLWYTNADQLCTLDVQATTPVPDCSLHTSGGWPGAAKGPHLFVQDAHGVVFRLEEGRSEFVLFAATQAGFDHRSNMGNAAYHADNLYLKLSDWNRDSHHFFRFPTQTAAEAVDVLPAPIMNVFSSGQPALGYQMSQMGYAVSEAGIFWTQHLGEDTRSARYVFHRPL